MSATLDLLWAPPAATDPAVRTEPRYLVLGDGTTVPWPANLHSVRPSELAGWVLAEMTCGRCEAPQPDPGRTDGLTLCAGEFGAITTAQLRLTYCRHCWNAEDRARAQAQRERMFPAAIYGRDPEQPTDEAESEPEEDDV